MYEHVSVTSQELGRINQTIQNSIQKNSTEWENIKGDLSQSNEELNELLKQKESMINELAYKNQNLQKEINLPKLDPNILNVLVIGHNAKLTDTILLASINPKTEKISFLSIPRDLYYKGRKINELYSKYGVTELQRAVSEITGIYPEKYVIFNFDSFVDLVDILGGVSIEVQKKLVDNAYPGAGNSYTTVVFEPGTYQMDGETALKYARSRKSTSDFDRAARQQQVIEAVKIKAKKLNITARLDLATKIYAKIKENIETNINLFDGLSYMQHYQNYQVGSANVLSTQNYLYSSKSNSGQYILLPQGGTYANIKAFVAENFK
ncbi:MAG: LCP family protein [Candidatus Gracilibacteria bacterium]